MAAVAATAAMYYKNQHDSFDNCDISVIMCSIFPGLGIYMLIVGYNNLDFFATPTDNPIVELIIGWILIGISSIVLGVLSWKYCLKDCCNYTRYSGIYSTIDDNNTV